MSVTKWPEGKDGEKNETSINLQALSHGGNQLVEQLDAYARTALSQVLESLLAETSRAFDSKSRRLGMVAETVLADINSNFHSSAGELQRLIPIQRQVFLLCHSHPLW